MNKKTIEVFQKLVFRVEMFHLVTGEVVFVVNGADTRMN